MPVPGILCRTARSFVTMRSSINNVTLPEAGEGGKTYVTICDEGGRGGGFRNIVTSQKS